MEAAREHPNSLKISIQVIVAYDNALAECGKEPVMKYRAIKMLEDAIDFKFQEAVQEED